MDQNLTQQTDEFMSPVPVSRPEYLNFYDALKKVMEGKRITKVDWNNEAIFGFLSDDGVLKLNLPEKVADWILSDGDMKGEDWVVLKDKN